MKARRILFALVAIAAATAMPASATSAGGRPTCFGKPATHVFDDSYHDGNGTNGNDVIVSSAHMTFGLGGNDLICGTGVEFQELYGDDGHDKIAGRGGNDMIDGGGGSDLGKGGAGDDLVAGRRGNDTLRGNDGDDHAYGNAGQDTCTAEREHQCEG